MTREELKEKLDDLIGLKSEWDAKYDSNCETRLNYYSSRLTKPPTLLFYIVIFKPLEGDWQFGGQSSALPGIWQELCHVGK